MHTIVWAKIYFKNLEKAKIKNIVEDFRNLSVKYGASRNSEEIGKLKHN